jgi:hypothetical protein
VGLILTVKFSVLFDFESVLFKTFCTKNYDESLPPEVIFLVNEFNRTECDRATVRVQCFSEFIKIFAQDKKQIK